MFLRNFLDLLISKKLRFDKMTRILDTRKIRARIFIFYKSWLPFLYFAVIPTAKCLIEIWIEITHKSRRRSCRHDRYHFSLRSCKQVDVQRVFRLQRTVICRSSLSWSLNSNRCRFVRVCTLGYRSHRHACALHARITYQMHAYRHFAFKFHVAFTCVSDDDLCVSSFMQPRERSVVDIIHFLR